MCITAQCADPTEVGIWWRDDATWRLYSKEAMWAILQALLKGQQSLKLQLVTSATHPRGALYAIDLLKMEQTNKASGHKRAIKLMLPNSLPSEFFPAKGEHCMHAGFPVARFQMHNSRLLAICRGNITAWKADGKADAVVNPSGLQGSNWLKGKLVRSFKSTPNIGNTSIISPLESSNNIEKANGGLAAALHHAAGPELQVALQKDVHFATGAGQCGDALITAGFELPVSHIIHTFAPAYQRSSAASSFALLQRTYKSALSLAVHNGLRYLAFPAISCGAGGFPLGFAAQAALEAVSSSDVSDVLEIHFVLLDQKAFMEWTAQASKSFSKHP